MTIHTYNDIDRYAGTPKQTQRILRVYMSSVFELTDQDYSNMVIEGIKLIVVTVFR